MHCAAINACLIVTIAMGGCAQLQPAAPAGVPVEPVSIPTTPAAISPAEASAQTASRPVPAPPVSSVAPPAAPTPVRAAVRLTGSTATNASTTTAKAPANTAAPPPAAPMARAVPPAASAKPEASGPKASVAETLDLGALEQRLRETRSIGLFTKLSLKNQVDDLLEKVRSYYRAQGKPPPTPLRQHYDGLLLKVIALLQDGDPPLAATILSSREAIWGILADPVKLSKT